MTENQWLVERFEEQRPHLRAVAYRMLGSFSEADDAVQETWIRASRADASVVENLGGWLTTIVARVCLNMLRARGTRREDLGPYVPDLVVTLEGGIDPEQEALLADSVGTALNVVLEMLSPAERLAFVLHDMFAVPFEEIAEMLGRSPDATRQLASRARRRVQGAAIAPDPDLDQQRNIVNAFFAAARRGDFDALVALLDPDVELRADAGARLTAASGIVHGAAEVAGRALMFAQPRAQLVPVLVNGAAGVVVVIGTRPIAIIGFTVAGGHIVSIAALADRERIGALHLAGVLDGSGG
jgi:RNA polymerase sigma-70 factor (ECF subfamily)